MSAVSAKLRLYAWKEYVCVLAAIILVFVVLVYEFWRQNREAVAVRDEVLKIQSTINEINVLSSKMKSAVIAHHRYLMLGEQKFKDEYYNFRHNNLGPGRHIGFSDTAESSFAKLGELLQAEQEQLARLDAVRRGFGAMWITFDDLINLYEVGRKAEAIDLLRGYVNDVVSTTRVLMRDMLAYEDEVLRRKIELRDIEASRRSRLVVLFLYFLTVLTIVFYTLSAWQKQKAQEAWRIATERADEIETANQRHQLVNEELSALNKAIQESSETQIKAVIDNALDAQIMMDEEGTVLRFNRAAERMFLYAPEEIIGRSVTALLIEPYASESLEHFRLHRETGGCSGLDHRHESIGRRKDNTIFPLDLSMSMFPIGGKLHISWFLRDITERKKAEAEVLRYTKELEKSNQDLDDFAYIASHDLKEPLRGLFNHAQFLLEDYAGKLDEDGQRRLTRLAFLSQRMEHLVSDLLYFSRLGRAEIAIQETDPNRIVLEIEHIIKSTMKEENLQISIAAPLPVIVCDKIRITEVFRNLIVNGIKYNDKSCKIIEVGYLSQANAPHGPEEDVFYVKDNGIGIEQQYFQDIFRIFRRLQKAEEGEQSTGSGLTFVKKIIERHKGHIWLESTPGKGTTFFFNLRPNKMEGHEHAQNE